MTLHVSGFAPPPSAPPPVGNYYGDTLIGSGSTDYLHGSTAIGFTDDNTYAGGDTWVQFAGSVDSLRRWPTGLRVYNFVSSNAYLDNEVGTADCHARARVVANPSAGYGNHGFVFCYDRNESSVYGYHMRQRTATWMELYKFDSVDGFRQIVANALTYAVGDTVWIKRVGNQLFTRRNAESYSLVYTDEGAILPGTSIGVSSYGNTNVPVWADLGGGPAS